MTEEEQSLANRSRSGDRAAFEALIHRTGRWLYARLYLQTGDPHRAEDLTQETFLTAWRRIGELSDSAAFRGWLAAIAHSVLLDSIKRERSKKRFRPGSTPMELDTLANADASPGEAADAAEQRQRALVMLRNLPEQFREPLMLRYLGGADYETISRQLGLNQRLPPRPSPTWAETVARPNDIAACGLAYSPRDSHAYSRSRLVSSHTSPPTSPAAFPRTIATASSNTSPSVLLAPPSSPPFSKWTKK